MVGTPYSVAMFILKFMSTNERNKQPQDVGGTLAIGESAKMRSTLKIFSVCEIQGY